MNPMTLNQATLSILRERYDENRFLDAYGIARPFLDKGPESLVCDPRTCIFLGRLANRLGSGQACEIWFRKGREIDAGDPYVRFYAGESGKKRNHLLHVVAELEKDPDLSGAPKDLKAVAFASHGWVYARLRDFEKAGKYIEKAKSQHLGKAWVACCEAEVLLAQDLWEPAEKVARQAWQQSPGMPQAAVTLANILVRLEKLKEAVDLFREAVENLQSYETLITTIWYTCALAERSHGPRKEILIEKAWDLSGRIERLAPLADPDTCKRIAVLKGDIALLQGDRRRIQNLAGIENDPFFEKVVRNIAENPFKPVRLLDCRPVYQKHNTCLPSSIATVLSGFDVDFDSSQLVKELTYRGTAVWQTVDWLSRRGFVSKPFLPTPELCLKLIENRIPFVLMLQTVYYYHAVAVIGADEQAGYLIIHDPSFVRLDCFLLENIDSRKDPFTPEALAIVPEKMGHLLDRIPESQSAPYKAYLDYLRDLSRNGGREIRSILEGLQKTLPKHPFSFRLKALLNQIDGNPIAGIRIQKQLLEKFPNSHPLQKEMLDSYYQTGNTPTIMKTLERIVQRKKWPGVRARQPWQYPPGDYVARFADYVGINRSGLQKATELIWEALRREPYNSFLYHVLGDLYYRHGEYSESILPYRLAAMLEIEHNHFALAYSDALRINGSEAEGLAFLKKRVELLGGSLKGGEVWITLLQALEGYGHPQEAVTAIHHALDKRGQDTDLYVYAVDFWIRMGQRKTAGECLRKVRESGHPVKLLQTAVSFYHHCGKWEKALDIAEKWIQKAPSDRRAREKYVGLTAYKVGRKKALQVTRKWIQENPADEFFEELHYQCLKDLFDDTAQKDVLRSRLKRNPQDAWALREMGFLLLQGLDRASETTQRKMERQIHAIFKQCEQLCPSEPAYLALKGDYFDLRGQQEKAAAFFIQALREDPGYHYGYRRAWQCSLGASVSTQRSMLKQLSRLMLRQSGFKTVARELTGMIAERFGVREANEQIDKWLTRLPYDPELIVAKAEILLYYGKSRTDAQDAANLLKKASRRFPYVIDLKALQVRACGILGREAEQLDLMRDILVYNPFHSHIRSKLAELLETCKETDGALQVLQEGLTYNPLDAQVHFSLIRLLWATGNQEQAREQIRKSLGKIPEKIDYRKRLVDFLLSVEENTMAIELADDGVRFFPEGAYLWQLYGDTLWRSHQTKDISDIEKCYRKALSLNPQLHNAADSLAELLTYQYRYDEALALIEPFTCFRADHADACARMAWILRKQGDAEALPCLKGNVHRWPTHAWSWRLLLAWLQEDEAWDMAREVLADVHPVMLDDPDFSAEKLSVLEQVGAPLEPIEKEWAILLREFPTSQPVYTRRFDQLMQRKAVAEAGEVIRTVAGCFPDSPYVLSRKCVYQAAAGDPSGVLDTALAVINRPEEISAWCLNRAWESLAEANKKDVFIQKAVEIIQAAAPIHRYTYGFLIDRIDAGWPNRKKVVACLRNLLQIAHQQRDEYQTARVIEALCDRKDAQTVLRFWKANRDDCRKSTEIWQAVGYVLNSRDKFREVEKWMSDWRDHPECEMWGLNNYMIGLQKSRKGLGDDKNLRELFVSSRFAIDNLHHDHTIRYVTSLFCMACLRLGEEDLFLEYCNRFETLLQNEEEGYWFHSEYRWLPAVLLCFRELLTTNDPTSVSSLSSKLIQTLPTSPKEGWIRREWQRRVNNRLGYRQRLWLGLRFRLKTG